LGVLLKRLRIKNGIENYDAPSVKEAKLWMNPWYILEFLKKNVSSVETAKKREISP